MHLIRLDAFFLLGSVALAVLSLSDGQCNLCSVLSNFACVSQTQFQVCVNGSTVGAVNSCPDGYVCSTFGTAICQPNQDGVVVSCGDCFTCDSSGTFACTGTQTYALCFGGTTPSNITGSCPQGFVCSIDFTEICGDMSLGVAPTCPTTGEETTTTTATTITSTTISPLTSPAAYCRNLQQYGRFPVGNNITSTCRNYVFCVVNGGVWSGQLYTCPGQTYFNSSSRLCGTEIPEDCS